MPVPRRERAVLDDPAELAEVDRPGPQVHHQPPDDERVAGRQGDRGDPAVLLRQQQHRQAVEQAERGGLAEIVHGQRGVAVAPQHRQGRGQQHVPADDQRGHPPRDEPADDEGDQRGQDVQPIGRRVEQLAEPAVLVEQPGQLAVGVVGDRADHQHDQRPPVVLRHQHQVEEQRDAQQPQEGQRVGDGQDPVRHDRPGSRWAGGTLDTVPPRDSWIACKSRSSGQRSVSPAGAAWRRRRW